MEICHKERYALTNGKIVTAGQIVEGHAVIVSAGKIEAVIPSNTLPDAIKVKELGGQWLCPGFIDLQLNGCGGVLFNDAISSETLDTMHQTNLPFGCTSFLPTLITCADSDIYRAITVTKEYQARHPSRVPGLHLEGPWLNPVHKGIHDMTQLRKPDNALLTMICDNPRIIRMITLAPEVCPAGTIEQLTEAGINVAIGHTTASNVQVEQSIKAGARFATHLFNAMPPLASREPGPVGAIFNDTTLRAGIIADGVHVDWQNIRLAWRLLGSDRLCLVTDATPAAGSMHLEQFQFGGQTVYYRDGKCLSSDGTLGGSALTLDQAVKNCVEQVKIPFAEVISMATITPARSIAMNNHIGQIKPGMQANLIVLDQHYAVIITVSEGRLMDWSTGAIAVQ